MDVFYTLPPVSRTITVAAVVVSALGYAGVLSLYRFIFWPASLYQFPPHIWRLFTSFLVTRPKFSIIMDPYFLYTYASQLETSPRFSQPGDFFVYLMFVAALIVAVSGFIFKGFTFIGPLITAVAYTFSQQNPNASAHFIMFSIPAKYLPWALVFATFVMAGPASALEEFGGIVAGHAYEFFTRIWPEVGGGRNWIKTPNFVWKLFGGGTGQPRQTSAGTAFASRNPPNGRGTARSQPASTTSGAAYGSVFKGSGRRLGGD